MLIKKRLATSLLALACFALPCIASAKDYFLTIGGGYSPMGNQISLEKNIQFFQRLLAEHKTDVDQTIYFADGDSPGRDLQYADPDSIPRVNRLLAEVLGSSNYLDLAYRSHQVPGISGATSRKNIGGWFDEVGSQMQSGDRLVLYVTAHGGGSRDRKKPNNTTIYLWNNETIKVSEMVERLDKLPKGVSVVTIMVQCHSGGFAHLIFDQGDSSKEVSPRDRCGFFATVYSRPAAGCTADVNEEDYQEYSTFFWAAIGGKTRLGDSVDPPDYDEDKTVSFEEAHAYTMITSDTIDIPIKTSGEFLRAALKDKIKKKERPEGWISSETPYEEILALASPAEAAVLEALSDQLDLDKPTRVKQSREEAKKIGKRISDMNKKQRGKSGTHRKYRKNIATQVKNRWPELANFLHPRTIEVLSQHRHELVTMIESHEDWPKLEKARKEMREIEEQKLDLDKLSAKHKRFIRTAENVVLTANLAKFATPELQQRHARMLAYEKGGLHRQMAAPPASEEAASEEAVAANETPDESE